MQTINVKGIGHVSMPPDTIIIKMQIDAKGEDLQEAMAECSTQLTAVKKATIEQLGINGISVEETRLFVEPTHLSEGQNSSFEGNSALLNGFKCRQDLSFRFDYDPKTLVTFINTLPRGLSNPVIDVIFTVKDQQALEDCLYKIASDNATQKAEIITKIAGKKLGAIVGFRFPEDEGDEDNELHFFSKDSFQYNLNAGLINSDFRPADIVESAIIELSYEICQSSKD